ncbi:MAG: ATP-binding protein [Bacteroidales bacterium]|nr:ATP-binding protein [Bacteroidales bacterium]
MDFYDREQELQELTKMREIAFNNHSQMTAIMGCRRIGKTTLVKKSCEGSIMVYLFVARSTEKELCSSYISVIKEALGIFIPSGINSFVEIFQLLMEAARERCFTLFIDEFQEFYKINPSIYSGMQDVWDSYKDTTHIHLIAGGSVQTMMHKVFLEYGEPLYGCCDSIIRLKGFTPSVLKRIMKDYNPQYENDDLLALYSITGGVPKYVELLVDRGALSRDKIFEQTIREYSLFIEEGNILLIQEFGKDYGVYYAILCAIASGRNTSAEISQSVGLKNVNGHLSKLEEDYELIRKKRPILSKPGSQTVRYELKDNFLRFWFRYIYKYQSYIQTGMYAALVDLIKADYPTYSGLLLEKYFRESLQESHQYHMIGAWWESSRKAIDNPNEIDIVALKPGDKEALVAEVKRNRKSFRPEDFNRKVEALRTKVLPHTSITSVCLTLDDM